MKKALFMLMSVVLALAVLTSVITPALAERPSRRILRQEDHKDGHKEGRKDGNSHDHNNHHAYRGHHRRHHHDEVIITGLFFLVINEIQERNEARESIKRSANILKNAQIIVQQNNACFGLGKALAHQERAIALFGKGNYKEAIYHTLWARAIALHIIDNPDGPKNEDEDWRNCDFRDCELVYSELTDKEAGYMETAPSPVEMREDLDGINITEETALTYEIKSNI